MVPLHVAGGVERELTAIALQVSELLLLTMKILSAKTRSQKIQFVDLLSVLKSIKLSVQH
jgi:hypothetical protein